jgi:hypothetical protein
VDTEYRFRLGRIHLIEAALRAHGFVEHRAHRAVGDENRVFQPFIEIVNLHRIGHFLVKHSFLCSVALTELPQSFAQAPEYQSGIA